MLFFPANQSEPVEYFDPLGNCPSNYVKEFLEKQKRSGLFNGKKIQGDTSIGCTLFCMFYVWLRLTGDFMKDIVNLFNDKDVIANDNIVIDFVNSLM